MSEKVLKVGNGLLHGVSNNIAQPGKMLWMYDGTTVLGTSKLDEAFPDRKIEYLDEPEAVWLPGMIFDVVFVTELRVVTDGEGLTFYWQ